MTARRLQQPALRSASTYKALGTGIMTALAILPPGSSAGLPECNPSPQEKPPTGQPSCLHPAIIEDLSHTGKKGVSATGNGVKLPTMNYDEGACKDDSPLEGLVNASVDDPLDHFLEVENILADFDGSRKPVFIQPETRSDPPNVPGVREILAAYEQGSPVKKLIKAKFPEGDFQYHLIAYLRNRIRTPFTKKGTLEAKLKDAYLIGVKEWCAAALDAFISQVEGTLTTDAESNESTDGQQNRKPAPWTQDFFFEQAASHQRRALESVVERSFEDRSTLRWSEKWHNINEKRAKVSHHVEPALSMSAEKSNTASMQELYFIRDLLRNLSPGLFLVEAQEIACELESFGAPRDIVDLLRNMRLDPEDVAEFKRVERSVQGADDTNLHGVSTTSAVERLDPLKGLRHKTFPLSVLCELYIRTCFFLRDDIPPFLQSRCELEDFKTEAINKIIELCNRSEHDKALSIMDQEFHKVEEFHENFFSLIRTAMRSYSSTKPLNGSENPGLSDLHGTPLGKILQDYAKGLQAWCARAHQVLIDRVDSAIDAAYLFDTEESRNFIKALEELSPTYARNVTWLMNQIDLSQMKVVPAPPAISVELPPQLEELRESIYTLDWLMQKMPWECFLSYRTNLASLVKELDGGRQGVSFLGNILETLTFRDRDEFGKYYPDAKRLSNVRYYRSRSKAGK